MVPIAKITKRQRKGIAFRERKLKKSKVTDCLKDEIDVPSLENQALVVATQDQQGRQTTEKAFLGRGKAGTEAETPVVVGKKRKRKTGEEAKGPLESDKPKAKRRGSDGSSFGGMGEPIEHHVGAGETGRMKQLRFILFLGNLRYTTTLEAIQAHFSTCDPPPTVRLLTPKPSTKSPTKLVTKSKGCAFLEFKHRGALQQGLKLHNTILDGRQINVELTAGGGGRGPARIKKLKQRNKDLEGQRRKRQDQKADAQSSGTRFSATSGAEQIHVRKRTWTVDDVEENGAHRGGQRHQKGSRERRPLASEFRTGVNAIPVG